MTGGPVCSDWYLLVLLTTDLVPAGRCLVWSAGVGEAGAGEALLLRVAGTLGTGTTRLQHYQH